MNDVKNFKGNEIDLHRSPDGEVVTLICKWTCNSPEAGEEMHRTILSSLLDGQVVGIYKGKVLYFGTDAFKPGLLKKDEST